MNAAESDEAPAIPQFKKALCPPFSYLQKALCPPFFIGSRAVVTAGPIIRVSCAKLLITQRLQQEHSARPILRISLVSCRNSFLQNDIRRDVKLCRLVKCHDAN